jgi:hypothetical protein
MATQSGQRAPYERYKEFLQGSTLDRVQQEIENIQLNLKDVKSDRGRTAWTKMLDVAFDILKEKEDKENV